MLGEYLNTLMHMVLVDLSRSKINTGKKKGSIIKKKSNTIIRPYGMRR
jgi:hypothetical protein